MTVKHVAVVGASGAVGERMIRLLEERRFPLASIKFLASPRSAGKTVRFRGEVYPIHELAAGAFAGVEIVLSSTPAAVSRQWSPIAAAAGAVVVDNSSAFRMDPGRPAGRPRGQPPRYPQARRDHRQPQLLDDPDGGRAQAAARLLPGAPRRRLHLSIGLGRRPEGDPRARSSDRGPRRARRHAPPRPSSPIRSSATASPRSTTSCPTATPRKR